ncbi:MAG: alginate O-acetyltransferase complex protein AlgI [Bradymonadia bacterium]|jgi:alginate O-acetyltransferase complex protein AlgI
MQFDNFIFPIFFAIVLALYWGVRRRVPQNVVLLVSSYVFYGWWDYRFLSLVALSTIVDFVIARQLDATDDKRRRKLLVSTSVVVNLGILGVFKYAGFFVASAQAALLSLGVQANVQVLEILLPVGISFYTFQTLSYTIDVYRREMPASRDLLAFGCYVAFFPQLVAGPIERATRLLPQFERPRAVTHEQWRSGLTLILYGFIKKIAVADQMSPYVDLVYAEGATEASGPLIFAATLAFAVQIYADFSAYSDIARGTARWLGIELCVNFDQPYRSRTPSEFWRRWHISLSSWLRDYLYIPLGGNRGSEWFTYRNLCLTMLLGGLWHGAAWNFVLWGAFHGAILAVYRFAKIDRKLRNASAATGYSAQVVFFLLTLYGWLLFRAHSWDQVVELTLGLGLGWSQWALAMPLLGVVLYFTAPVLVHHALAKNLGGEKWAPSTLLPFAAVTSALVLFGVLQARASQAAFIYFQF